MSITCRRGDHSLSAPLAQQQGNKSSLSAPRHLLPGMVGLAPKWVRLAPNRINPGLFQIRLRYILARLDKKSTEI